MTHEIEFKEEEVDELIAERRKKKENKNKKNKLNKKDHPYIQNMS